MAKKKAATKKPKRTARERELEQQLEAARKQLRDLETTFQSLAHDSMRTIQALVRFLGQVATEVPNLSSAEVGLIASNPTHDDAPGLLAELLARASAVTELERAHDKAIAAARFDGAVRMARELLQL